MKVTEDNSQGPETFASGQPHSLRRWIPRLLAWAFSPPFFPSELTWLLLAVIASNCAVELLPQPPAYWVDPGIAFGNASIGIPLTWGLWTIAAYAGYMLLVGLALSLLTAKAATGLWMGLGVYHFLYLTYDFGCGILPYFPFQDQTTCQVTHAAALVIAALFWGYAILRAARAGLIHWYPSRTETRLPAKPGLVSARNLAIAWMALMGVALTLTAIVPKPAWKPVQTTHTPPGRVDASLAYDTRRSKAILFGGTDAWTVTGGWKSTSDTWEWDGKDWSELHPAHSPSPRIGAGMVYDRKRDVVVLFGGGLQLNPDERIFYGDTWEWDGQDWLEVTPSHSPPARQAANMYYDPLREKVVIYAGFYDDPVTYETVFLDDAWEWDGSAWQQIPFDEPRKETGTAIVFEPTSQLPFLVDGEGIWAWQDRIWVQLNFSTAPKGRWGSRMTIDPGHKQVILFGGDKDGVVYDETWAYDGRAWREIITDERPPARSGHCLFYDQTRGRVMFFGGLKGGTIYDDMWELTEP